MADRGSAQQTNAQQGNAQRGSVTAEFAVALPAVIVVLATCLGCLQLGATQLRLQDAASTAARALSRGDAVPAIAGARFTAWREGELHCVRFTQDGGMLAVGAESCALG